ncbi:hypothetical protein MBLNU230_g6122t1 [Neophaeotheca triangularis]
MFEKDIYQLIRGLRANKGREREYIQECLRECRKEVKSQDMDLKATALLKLVYLEMFGHDMSWASFNVLEVMSSQKYLQKRVGYLAAVQSFRPDTEVLMLAENLLKKDLAGADKATIGLPLGTIPHVVSPSMANSLLTDLVPRLSHSSPAIRKKTIVTLYRLAVVYPETLRPAWPKIKERLLDENEDSSVTAAIVNVVCELGWRRPQDFLPLAPRLFELLTEGGNNWMAIKIIKLFSTLTPLEPRLVKKLLPPLTSIIKTTPAMSLLYECINGIIQGGIMEAAEDTQEGEDIARLCVSKLRAMLVMEGDPNLRYVALLAFAKLTSGHAYLVEQHQDVILECIDDADISIRTRALDLVVGMVNSNNLQTVVERLLRQLRNAGVASVTEDPDNDRGAHEGVEPRGDDEEVEMAASLRRREQVSNQPPPLPEDYRASVIERILEMCSRDTYANMSDFEWYIGILVDLVKQCPASPAAGRTISDSIGAELLNVAVRVKAVRPDAAAASQSLLLSDQSGSQGVLASAAFVAGEYANMLPDPEAVLTALLHSSSAQLPANVLTNYLQAIPKVLSALTSSQHVSWTPQRQSWIVLLIARVTHFLEPLTLHPALEVQERAVEYLDLMRLASEASSNQHTEPEDGDYTEPPLLLTQAIPSLFTGMELNPVSAAALRKVPPPEDLDLDATINSGLQMLLSQADYDTDLEDGEGEVQRFYYEKPSTAIPNSRQTAAADLLDTSSASRGTSYQDSETQSLDPEQLERKKLARRERQKDDPYYIDPERASGASTPLHNILRSSNGEELDVDSIPVMELKLDNREARPESHQSRTKPQPSQKPKRHFEIASDETLGGDDDDHSIPSTTNPNNAAAFTLSSSTSKPPLITRAKKSLLEVDSSGLSSLSLSENTTGGSGSKFEIERRQAEEEEMAKAMKEVERLRLEMQRAQERVGVADALPEEGTVVQRKKKKKARGVELEGNGDEGVEEGEEAGVRKKKKKKKRREGMAAATAEGMEGEQAEEPVGESVKVRKKKKRQVTFDGDGDGDGV